METGTHYTEGIHIVLPTITQGPQLIDGGPSHSGKFLRLAFGSDLIPTHNTSQTAEVDVYIGGGKQNAVPIQIGPGQRFFQRYGVNAGSVRVVSTNGVNIFASERSKYLQSFNEILGLAGNQLATDYWFTSYDDVGLITFLVIGLPEQ